MAKPTLDADTIPKRATPVTGQQTSQTKAQKRAYSAQLLELLECSVFLA